MSNSIILILLLRLIALCGKKPLVINEKELLDKIYYNRVFRNGNWNEYVVGELRSYSRIIRMKRPSLVTMERDGSVKWDNNSVIDQNEIN